MSAFIRCNDHVEILMFEKSIWAADDELLEFSIMDSYIGSQEYQGLFGQLRRAWHALFAKPICYAGIVVTEKERVRVFWEECLAILSSNAEEFQYEENDPAE